MKWWQSGYRQDVFYSEYPDIKDSQDFYSELSAAFANLKKFEPWLVLNDGSLQAQLWIQLLQQESITFSVLEDHDIETLLEDMSDDFFKKHSEKWNSQGVYRPSHLLYAFLSERFQEALLLPGGELRILNASFSRKLQKSLGTPYFVFVDNERFHNLEAAFSKRSLPVILNPLKLTPTLFRSYFVSDSIQKWLRDPEGPHNYHAEQSLLSSQLKSPRHGVPLNLKIWEGFATEPRQQQSPFPLHRLFQRVLNTSPYFNSLAEEWYGSVD